MTKTKKRSQSQKCRYDPQILNEAVNAVKTGMTLRAASSEYDIPRTTIYEHAIRTPKKWGRPTVLTALEEDVIADTINQMAVMGYGLGSTELQLIIKKYLDKTNQVVSQFNNNKPGRSYIQAFMARNNLSFRRSTNIKSRRSVVNQESAMQFFVNLMTAGDISRENIYNFGETAISDYPANRKVIARKGIRRVEMLTDYSRNCISIMCCGSASGEILPFFVCYKAESLKHQWILDGPPDAMYTASKSGWLDKKAFEQWFIDLFLPIVQNRPGKKLLIGDSSPNHFSSRIVQLANDHNIYFTNLPKNSIHILQPLHVTVFKPLKNNWRTVLSNFRKDRLLTGPLSKADFPALLKALWFEMDKSISNNLISGFKATGIYPRDPNVPLKHLPDAGLGIKKGMNRKLDDELIQLLRENRQEVFENAAIKSGHLSSKVIPGLAMVSNLSATHSTESDDYP